MGFVLFSGSIVIWWHSRVTPKVCWGFPLLRSRKRRHCASRDKPRKLDALKGGIFKPVRRTHQVGHEGHWQPQLWNCGALEAPILRCLVETLLWSEVAHNWSQVVLSLTQRTLYLDTGNGRIMWNASVNPKDRKWWVASAQVMLCTRPPIAPGLVYVGIVNHHYLFPVGLEHSEYSLWTPVGWARHPKLVCVWCLQRW